jgi:hypothetical protein
VSAVACCRRCVAWATRSRPSSISNALLDITLRGSIEALDADAGCLALGDRQPRRLPEDSRLDLGLALGAAGDAATATRLPQQIEHKAGWALALPVWVGGAAGAVCIARRARPFQPDEVELLSELAAKAQTAAAEILGHHALREEAVTDALTGLGNRRKLAADVSGWFASPGAAPRLLVLLDLDGFKAENDTFGHPAGDALLARLGAKLGAEVARAAELHDVGKVGIPDAILGERILNAAPALRPVARLVRSTHERWDGAGYPDGLKGTEIPRGARIVAVCDAYDAMTSDRAYRGAMSHEAACRELRAMAGTQFDPEVVAAFVAEVERHDSLASGTMSRSSRRCRPSRTGCARCSPASISACGSRPCGRRGCAGRRARRAARRARARSPR